MEEKEKFDDGSAVEIFDGNSTITLYDDDENPIEFYEIASIEYNEKFYELLQPVEKMEDVGEDEALIFEYEVEEGTTDKLFKPIFDEALLSEVFDVYLRAVADYSFDDCECDGNCDCHDGHCDCGGDCKHEK